MQYCRVDMLSDRFRNPNIRIKYINQAQPSARKCMVQPLSSGRLGAGTHASRPHPPTRPTEAERALLVYLTAAATASL